MSRFHQNLLWFLAIDLAFSALALVWLLGARRSTLEFSAGLPDVREKTAGHPAARISPSSHGTAVSANEEAGSAVPATSIISPSRQAELQALLRDIQAAQTRIGAELDRQAEIFGEEQFRTDMRDLTLAEFQAKFPEEYEQFEVKRMSNMQQAKMFVLKRQHALAMLHPEGISPDEHATLRKVYEYLLECDQNAVAGRPVRPLPEDLPERAELEALVEKYARLQSGCTPELVDAWRAVQNFEWGTYFAPLFIMDKSVVYREDQ